LVRKEEKRESERSPSGTAQRHPSEGGGGKKEEDALLTVPAPRRKRKVRSTGKGKTSSTRPHQPRPTIRKRAPSPRPEGRKTKTPRKMVPRLPTVCCARRRRKGERERTMRKRHINSKVRPLEETRKRRPQHQETKTLQSRRSPDKCPFLNRRGSDRRRKGKGCTGTKLAKRFRKEKELGREGGALNKRGKEGGKKMTAKLHRSSVKKT